MAGFHLRPLTAEDGDAMAGWSYEGPWSVYDVGEAIEPAADFWAVLDEDGELAGYACYGVEARVPGLEEVPGVLDVGVSMDPARVGQGLGRDFVGAVLDHARTVHDAPRLRAVVQDWNQRSRRLMLSLGFEETGEHSVAAVRYVIYERASSS